MVLVDAELRALARTRTKIGAVLVLRQEEESETTKEANIGTKEDNDRSRIALEDLECSK